MKRKFWMVSLVLTLVMIVASACSFSASTANIKDAQMAKDEENAQVTTTFSADDVFYVNVDLANAPEDTKVKAVWTAVEVEGNEPNTLIDQSELAHGSGTLNFKLTNQNAWPVGKYKVDLYLNEKLDRTMEFQVQ